ncbi:MAG: nitroreductase family protein [Pirellulaceae bacterium]
MERKPTWKPLDDYHRLGEPEMCQRSANFYAEIRRRRTVREFSDQAVPEAVIRNAILSAGTAPNGANLQPWHFAIVQSPEIKKQIRVAAEEEEEAFYNGRAQEWLDALAPLGTDASKPFLEVAPTLIVVFSKAYDLLPDGARSKTITRMNRPALRQAS